MICAPNCRPLTLPLPPHRSNYAELDDATLIVGTVLAYSYITMTGANVQGATISLSAAVTLTGAAVRLPSASALEHHHVPANYSYASSLIYATPVNMFRASSFAVLGASTLTNVGPSVIYGDCGSYVRNPPGLAPSACNDAISRFQIISALPLNCSLALRLLVGPLPREQPCAASTTAAPGRLPAHRQILRSYTQI